MKHRVGIVLSGGGARGIAHIGVLEALEEHGIEPTCISGNSSGAIVGALYAAGYSPEKMLRFFETHSPFRLSKVALRKPGIIDTEKAVADFLEYFPDDSFEALDKQLFVTATDIVNGRLEIFTSGPLVRAILASSSVPMVFAPTELSKRWLVDGGIINNFPVEPLKALCDSILGVYASPLRTLDRSDLKSGLAVSHRALELGMHFASRRKFHDCDILLCPEGLREFGVFDTKRLPEIRRIGYSWTITRIDSIREALQRSGG
ncbi:MAG: patatin-like phospholipase family protein [Acidobacteriota bacterium]|nr:patatin-like phospholipase family protein [Acidobacteriota bacterium]